MANIVYGKSLNPVGKDNAKSRRNARRAEEAIKAREIEAILASAFSQEAPQRRVELSRAEIACKRPAADRVVKAVDTETEYHKQILAGASMYVEHRISTKYQKVSNEAGRQIHAVQKMRGKSIPLI